MWGLMRIREYPLMVGVAEGAFEGWLLTRSLRDDRSMDVSIVEEKLPIPMGWRLVKEEEVVQKMKSNK